MAVKKGIIGTASIAQDVFDDHEERIRIASHADGNTVSYEDLNFTSADNSSVLNIFSDLGRKAHKGYFKNDGPGTIQLEISFNGTTYGGLHTLQGGDELILDDLNINKIRITYIDNSSYRCMVA